jgi:hypothetical protein
MDTAKSSHREQESQSDSTGDRRTGSVGERPDLAGGKDSGNRTPASKPKKNSTQQELDGETGNDPGLGGE